MSGRTTYSLVDQCTEWTGPLHLFCFQCIYIHFNGQVYCLKTILINFQRSCNNFYPRFRIWTFYMFFWSSRFIIILNNDMLTTVFIVNFLFSFSMYIQFNSTKSLNSTVEFSKDGQLFYYGMCYNSFSWKIYEFLYHSTRDDIIFIFILNSIWFFAFLIIFILFVLLCYRWLSFS